jgi:hypothetical protein
MDSNEKWSLATLVLVAILALVSIASIWYFYWEVIVELILLLVI